MSHPQIHIRPLSKPVAAESSETGLSLGNTHVGEAEADLRIAGSADVTVNGLCVPRPLRGRGNLTASELSLCGALAVVTALTLSTPLAAQQLIRCPDWQSLVEQERVVSFRKSPPKQSFETALATNSARKTSAPSQTSAAAQGSGKPQAGTTKTTSPLRASMRKTSAGAAACPVYTVKKGDTLGAIAKAQLGSSGRYRDLMKLNGITSTTSLKIGQRLTLPCATAGQSATVAAAVAAPAPKPMPIWRGKKGEYLTDVFQRWGKSAGYTVVKDGTDDWRLSVPVAVQGTFEEALQQVIAGFEDTGRPPGVSIYSNKVVKVGAP